METFSAINTPEAIAVRRTLPSKQNVVRRVWQPSANQVRTDLVRLGEFAA